jgi:GntR family transcriptional repressor for pyruvate dehydrogenase complex
VTRRSQRPAVTLQRLPSLGIKERVAGQLRGLIEAGSLQAGEQLPSERELAEQLGVSRSTVREAVQFLGALGLVEIRHGSGTFVRADGDLPSEWLQWTQRHQVEVHELLEVRRGLEAVAAELAAERSHDLGAMEAALADMEAAIDGPDVPGLVEADLAFHEIVISAAGQLHTVQIWRTIAPRIRAYFFRYERFRSFEETVEEHRVLLAALQTRDPAIVLAQLERHIDVPAPPGAPKVQHR